MKFRVLTQTQNLKNPSFWLSELTLNIGKRSGMARNPMGLILSPNGPNLGGRWPFWGFPMTQLVNDPVTGSLNPPGGYPKGSFQGPQWGGASRPKSGNDLAGLAVKETLGFHP